MQTGVCPEPSAVEHSTYDNNFSEEPKSFFCAWQCGHQKAPPLSFKQVAKASYLPGPAGVALFLNKTVAISPKIKIPIIKKKIFTLFIYLHCTNKRGAKANEFA